jgi:hypothetical protein
MNGFEQAIKTYLDNRAKEDQLFAQTYKKENKSIEECCKYIIQEVKKTGRQGFADDEIFGMAIHYYDEDNIKIEGKTPSCKVVHNQKTDKTFSESKPKSQEPVKTQEKPKSNIPNLFDQPKAQTPVQTAKPQTKAEKKKQAEELQFSLF